MERPLQHRKFFINRFSNGFSSCAFLWRRLDFLVCLSIVFFCEMLLHSRLMVYNTFVRVCTRKRTHPAYVWEVLSPLERACPL